MRDFQGEAKLGVRSSTFTSLLNDHLSTKVAQYYGIVQGGLPNAKHLFQGVNRPLADGEGNSADGDVLIYAWRPRYDYEWRGDIRGGNPRQMQPPPERVFVVLVKQQPPDADGVCGTIEHWNWVEEDSLLRQAPVSWEERYARKLWSR